MDLGNSIRSYSMKFKMFLDKGREYYDTVVSLISLAVLVGVWLPYIQEGLMLVGIVVPKIILSTTMLVGGFIVVNIGLVLAGWFTFKKDFTQSEWTYKALQHPIQVLGVMNVCRQYASMALLNKTWINILKKVENEGLADDFSHQLKSIKKDFPIRLEIGNETLLDVDELSFSKLNEIIDKTRSMR